MSPIEAAAVALWAAFDYALPSDPAAVARIALDAAYPGVDHGAVS